MAEIDKLLGYMAEHGSSDLHLKAGSPPAVRLNGRLILLRDLPVLTPEATKALAFDMMDDRQRESFENRCESDFAYSLRGVGRFRVNVFHQRGSIGQPPALGHKPQKIRPPPKVPLLSKILFRVRVSNLHNHLVH